MCVYGWRRLWCAVFDTADAVNVTLNSLPIMIGRDATLSGNLSLNVAKFSDKPSVKKVSHKHMEIHSFKDRFEVRCHGRNGIVVNSRPYQQNERVVVENNFAFTVGPCNLTFRAIENTVYSKK
jgi:hypothetical protein